MPTFSVILFSRRPIFRLWCGCRYYAARGRCAIQCCVPGDARPSPPRVGIHSVCGVDVNSFCAHQVGVNSDTHLLFSLPVT